MGQVTLRGELELLGMANESGILCTDRWLAFHKFTHPVSLSRLVLIVGVVQYLDRPYHTYIVIVEFSCMFELSNQHEFLGPRDLRINPRIRESTARHKTGIFS